MKFYSSWQPLSKTECDLAADSSLQRGCSSVFPAVSGDDHIQPGDWCMTDILQLSSWIQRDRLQRSLWTGQKPLCCQPEAHQAKLLHSVLWLDQNGLETSLERFYKVAF